MPHGRIASEQAEKQVAREAAARDALDAHVKRIVDEFPPLTAEQRDRISALLRPPAP